MATSLSRMMKKIALTKLITTPHHRNYTSAIFTTPLKNTSSSTISSSSSSSNSITGGDFCKGMFPRISAIPALHFFSSVSKDDDDNDLNKAGEPNPSLEQITDEGPDEELDERSVQQAFNEKNRGSMVQARSTSSNRTRNPNLNRTISRLADLYRDSTAHSRSPYKYGRNRRRIKKINLPTHYCEVNYRTLKAVVFYGPNIDHIPHGISKKDLNLLGVHQAKP